MVYKSSATPDLSRSIAIKTKRGMEMSVNLPMAA
jgi:hypothetical protein